VRFLGGFLGGGVFSNSKKKISIEKKNVFSSEKIVLNFDMFSREKIMGVFDVYFHGF
jgi:hypothetical protein